MSRSYNNENNPLYWDLHCSPYTTHGTQTVVASSTLGSQGSFSYRASNIIDYNHETAWSENARIKRLKVYRNGTPICILELQNSRSLQNFAVEDLIGRCRTINKLRFEIMEVYPGTKYQDTVISEIYFTDVP